MLRLLQMRKKKEISGTDAGLLIILERLVEAGFRISVYI